MDPASALLLTTAITSLISRIYVTTVQITLLYDDWISAPETFRSAHTEISTVYQYISALAQKFDTMQRRGTHIPRQVVFDMERKIEQTTKLLEDIEGWLQKVAKTTSKRPTKTSRWGRSEVSRDREEKEVSKIKTLLWGQVGENMLRQLQRERESLVVLERTLRMHDEAYRNGRHHRRSAQSLLGRTPSLCTLRSSERRLSATSSDYSARTNYTQFGFDGEALRSAAYRAAYDPDRLAAKRERRKDKQRRMEGFLESLDEADAEECASEFSYGTAQEKYAPSFFESVNLEGETLMASASKQKKTKRRRSKGTDEMPRVKKEKINRKRSSLRSYLMTPPDSDTKSEISVVTTRYGSEKNPSELDSREVRYENAMKSISSRRHPEPSRSTELEDTQVYELPTFNITQPTPSVRSTRTAFSSAASMDSSTSSSSFEYTPTSSVFTPTSSILDMPYSPETPRTVFYELPGVPLPFELPDHSPPHQPYDLISATTRKELATSFYQTFLSGDLALADALYAEAVATFEEQDVPYDSFNVPNARTPCRCEFECMFLLCQHFQNAPDVLENCDKLERQWEGHIRSHLQSCGAQSSITLALIRFSRDTTSQAVQKSNLWGVSRQDSVLAGTVSCLLEVFLRPFDKEVRGNLERLVSQLKALSFPAHLTETVVALRTLGSLALGMRQVKLYGGPDFDLKLAMESFETLEKMSAMKAEENGILADAVLAVRAYPFKEIKTWLEGVQKGEGEGNSRGWFVKRINALEERRKEVLERVCWNVVLGLGKTAGEGVLTGACEVLKKYQAEGKVVLDLLAEYHGQQANILRDGFGTHEGAGRARNERKEEKKSKKHAETVVLPREESRRRLAAIFGASPSPCSKLLMDTRTCNDHIFPQY